MFNMKTGEPPASLVVLNDWIYAQHLPPLPKFHEKHHSVEMEGLDRKFYAQMRPLKFSEREPQEEGKDRKPHRVWDEKEADRYVRGNSKDLQPLEDFIAGPSRTNWKITPVSVFNIQPLAASLLLKVCSTTTASATNASPAIRSRHLCRL